MNLLKKPRRKAFGFLRGRQLGFALPIAILIVVVLIVAGVAGYYSYTSYKAYREIKGPEMVKPEQAITEEACEEITNRFERGGCYFDVATENKDSSLCEKTTDEAACYQQIAIATKDIILCKKITESTSKDGCYYFIAIKTKEDGLCEKIINNIQKTACHAIVKKDSSICEEIADSYGKQICYMNFTERTKTEEEEVEKPKVEKPVVDETADWKIYRNEEYGYEIKYPQDWETRERSLMSDLGHRDFVWIQSNGDEFSVEIWDFSFYSYNQLTEPPPGGIDPDTIEKKEIIIDSQLAIELSYVAVGDGDSGARKVREVFIQKNQLLYKIRSTDSKKCDQILSTFKFIK